ncbi:MAG: HYR domain-containing protein, partial [Bacteroidota bacterium]
SSQGADMAYAWTTSDGRFVSGETSLNPVIDAAGTYQLLVTNTASGCTNTAAVTVIQRQNVSASLAGQTNVNCNGGANGAASVEATGGNNAFSFTWSNGSSDAAIANLAAGNYTVTVTDGENCTAVASVDITEPTAVFANASATSQIESGINDGTATADPVGGVAPYTFQWSNGETSQSISNLSPGTYIVSVTDANGCVVSQSVTVNSVDCAISATSQVTDVICPGGADGAASVTITGGLEPLAYLWSNGATSESISGLTAGNYAVTVTDDAGCIAQANITVNTNDPEAPVVTAENALIILDQSGSASISPATVNAQGSDNCGVAGITVSPSSFDCTNLGEHDVVVTVTDVSGLTSSVTVTVKVVDTEAPVVTCPDNIVVCSYNNVVSYQPANAQDNCLILNGQWQQNSGLPSGSEFPVGTTEQRFTYTDASGNAGSCSFTVTVTPPINITNLTIVNESNGQSNGSIDITVEGGVAPLSFLWTSNGQDIANTEDVSGLAAGRYTGEISDANGWVFKRENFEI